MPDFLAEIQEEINQLTRKQIEKKYNKVVPKNIRDFIERCEEKDLPEAEKV